MEIHPSQGWERSHKARTITAREWDTQRDTFTRLYITEDRQLTHVRRIMADEYKFFANPKQCKAAIKRWGLKKNSTKKKTAATLKTQRRQALQGKDTDFTLGEQPVGREELNCSQKKCSVEDMKGRSNLYSHLYTATPLGIEYSTPKQASSIHDSFRIEGGCTLPPKLSKTDTPQDLNFPEGNEVQDVIPFTPAVLKEDLSEFMALFDVRDPNTEDINTLPFTPQASDPFSIDLNAIDLPETHSTGVISLGPQQAPIPQDPMEWDPILWGNSLIEMGSTGEKESYLALGTKAVDYTTSLQLLWRNPSGHLVEDTENLGDEIKCVKEALAEMSKRLARLMEERRLLGGHDKITLTIHLIKAEGMIDNPEYSYTAQRLVVLGWERTKFEVYNSV